MPDLTPEGLRARAREIVAVEPDGTSWRVVLVCGVQRSSVIRLSEREACEAYAAWIQDQILVPAFTALVAEARRAQRADIQEFIERVPDRTLTEVITFVRQSGIRAQEETP